MAQEIIKIIPKGDVIIREGAVERSAYMIKSGKVKVLKSANSKDSELATLGPGEIFGEMGLIEDKSRSASIIALEDTELVVINREYFNELFGKNPNVLLPIIKSLFARLRDMSEKYAAIDTCDDFIDRESEVEGILVEDKSAPLDSSISDYSHIVLSGLTEESKKSLAGVDFEIKSFPFKVSRYTIGQDEFRESVLVKNDFYIKEANPPYYVAENHFLIDAVGRDFVIVNRHSTNSLYVNGEQVEEFYVLKNENEIIVGSLYSPYKYHVAIVNNTD